MKICLYATRSYDEQSFLAAAPAGVDFLFLEDRLSPATAALAAGCDAACIFVNDDAGAASLEALSKAGVQYLALRSAGYNHVDLAAAERLGIPVVRVPAYSPNAVAEHTIALILALNRTQLTRATGAICAAQGIYTGWIPGYMLLSGSMPGVVPAASQEETTTGFLTLPLLEPNLLSHISHASWLPFG